MFLSLIVIIPIPNFNFFHRAITTSNHQIRKRKTVVIHTPCPDELESKEGLKFVFVIIVVAIGIFGILATGILTTF